MANVIEQNLPYLCNTTTALNEILLYLISHGVITSTESEEIESGTTNLDNCKKFYMTISRKLSNKTTIRSLTQALQATNQDHIVQKLNFSSKYFGNDSNVDDLKNMNKQLRALQDERKLYSNLLSQLLAAHADGASEEQLNSANENALKIVEKKFLHLQNYKTRYKVQFLKDKDKMFAELYADAVVQNKHNIRIKKITDDQVMLRTAMAEAKLTAKQKEAELLAAQAYYAKAEAAAKREKVTMEAEHKSTIIKLQEEAEQERRKNKKELDDANLKFNEMKKALLEILDAAPNGVPESGCTKVEKADSEIFNSKKQLAQAQRDHDDSKRMTELDVDVIRKQNPTRFQFIDTNIDANEGHEKTKQINYIHTLLLVAKSIILPLPAPAAVYAAYTLLKKAKKK